MLSLSVLIILNLSLYLLLGTHVAGIVAANATQINETGFIPFQPFVGVAPQAILGGCKL